jgi:hypothetical protein
LSGENESEFENESDTSKKLEATYNMISSIIEEVKALETVKIFI